MLGPDCGSHQPRMAASARGSFKCEGLVPSLAMFEVPRDVDTLLTIDISHRFMLPVGACNALYYCKTYIPDAFDDNGPFVTVSNARGSDRQFAL